MHLISSSDLRVSSDISENVSVSSILQTGVSTTRVPLPKFKMTSFLPEYNLIDFLLKTPHTRTLQAYLDSFGVVLPYDNRDGKRNVTWT